ncbi:leucine-rich repeat domain-containing protein [Arcicella lustrica]|uniref:non-specific serine/threonine protein kinase n=1 Tax=Arcicella lustrica TaxID=2984196 RepID=A0ABU5SKI8_9BACT|nr:leucine-rich repeat domain-containing protein [Arcicella sp. DC25W]MEA5427524.1 leucine-rich repeat domain-containing protein [Arcicella sp. DC25W]
MEQEQVKPQVILELEKAFGARVWNFELNNEGEITMLDFSHNRINNLYPLLNLVDLEILILAYNQISELLPLSNLAKLKKLDLTKNQISDLSPLSNLLQLKDLDLEFNQISDLSPLTKLIDLEILDLRLNPISDLSPLSNLINIKSLILVNNQISDLSPLADLVNLNALHLWINKIRDLSPLSNLLKLKILNLADNQIRDLSPLSNLLELKILYLSNNQISDLLPLATLENLQGLGLNDNQISDLSPLSNLVIMKKLFLSNNRISDLLPLSNLIDLEEIDLRNNNIQHLKKNDIINFKSLEVVLKDANVPSSLNLYGNPLPSEMIEAIKSGGEALFQYFEAQEKGTVKIEEAKMVLLGEPRAGKTTLQKYLMGLPIDENEISTPDIAISSWKPFENDKAPDEGGNIKINLWDFGGQEIQYSLHKLFMTTDTLYIIVLDSTKDQNPEKYIAFLENYAPKAPFIIINNYADVLTSSHLKIDANQLRERYNGKDEKRPVLKAIFNRVSVLKAAQIEPSWRKIMDEVEQTIKSELLQLENLNKEFPIEYQNVKEAIEKEYNKPNKHYITMSYFRELCKSLDVTDTEDRRIAILKYLNEIGVLRYFNDSPLMDRHILNPKWLIDGAYSLIINQRTIESQGVLRKEQACKILERSNKFQFYEEEATFIFKTMNFYGLLHFEESEQKLYIPIRFGSNQPIALSEFYEAGKHFYFDFKADIPEDIMPYLIVKHFSEIKNKQYWSKGAVFIKDDIRVLAKVEDRTIHFYIIGKYHQSYFDTIRSTLKKTLEKLPGLEYEEMVEFEYEDKKIKAKYTSLINCLKKNRREYVDYDNDVEVPLANIVEILGGYFSQAEINKANHNYFYGGSHYHGDVTNNDNRYQQTHIFNELERLVKTSQEPNDQKELKELIEELKAFKNEKKDEKKESLGKSVLGKIKKMSSEVAEEGIKDKLKDLFPAVLQMGIEAIKRIDLQQIENLLF